MASVPRVLVTGASGFIATQIVQQLQQNGNYLVRGTVRSLKNPRKIDPLMKLCGNTTHELELVEADLTKDEGWLEAVKGCQYVIHTASPVSLEEPADENDLIVPAVDGTLRVLKAVTEAGGVKRVVLTSSVAAVLPEIGLTKPLTEEDWTDPNHPKTGAYTKSKTLAEKAAWDYLNRLGNDDKFELSVLNPGFVLGPVLSSGDGTSISVIKGLLTGRAPGWSDFNFAVIDIRDVAAAHINAMTIAEAAGNRHLLTFENFWVSEICKVIEDEFKPLGYNPPTSIPPGDNKVSLFENTRMKTVLGIKPIAGKKTIVDMCYSLIEGGYVEKTEKYKQSHNAKK